VYIRAIFGNMTAVKKKVEKTLEKICNETGIEVGG
jgi:hypothetical protein